LLGGDLETGGFWIASPFMPMDGPSRGKAIVEKTAPSFPFFDRLHPLVPTEVIDAFCKHAEKKGFQSSQKSKHAAEQCA